MPKNQSGISEQKLKELNVPELQLGALREYILSQFNELQVDLEQSKGFGLSASVLAALAVDVAKLAFPGIDLDFLVQFGVELLQLQDSEVDISTFAASLLKSSSQSEGDVKSVVAKALSVDTEEIDVFEWIELAKELSLLVDNGQDLSQFPSMLADLLFLPAIGLDLPELKELGDNIVTQLKRLGANQKILESLDLSEYVALIIDLPSSIAEQTEMDSHSVYSTVFLIIVILFILIMSPFRNCTRR